jgi:hypothetical protein
MSTHRLFSRDEWFSLPLKLRVRYWRETDYGRLAPSAELIQEIKQHLPTKEKFA